jgi:G3E family GTPase
VDTERLVAQGYRVEQVAGACFCCSFDALLDRATKLAEKVDIILAEPVGSCTDLAATVSAPIFRYRQDLFELLPYTVLVDPILVSDLIVNQGTAGFSAEVGYIFRKQLEEADVICLNKVDQVTADKLPGLLSALWEAFPEARQFPISALTSTGVRQWIDFLLSTTAKPRIIDVDYDIYAQGEAELGWLNFHADVKLITPQSANSSAMLLIRNLVSRLDKMSARIAHVKVLVSAGSSFALAHKTATNPYAILSASSNELVHNGKILINARVAVDPDLLAGEVMGAVAEYFGASAILSDIRCKSFRPGRPEPVHRLTVV